MAKKIILISSVPVCIILASIALILTGIGRGQAQQQMSIEQARSQIIELADAGKLKEVDEAIDKLITNYAGSSELSSNLFIIADSFAWRRLWTEADRLYRIVTDKSSDSALTTKAQVGLSRVEILNLIGQKKFSAAREQVDSMAVEFRDEPDCAVALFQIGQEFTWQRRYAESKDAFDKIVEIQPNNSLAGQSKLWSARTEVCANINGNKVKDEVIVASIDKLIADFEGDSGLPDALFWISREYEWTKGPLEDRTKWFDAPNSVYQKLIEKFNYSEAQWDYKRLSQRMKIFNLLKEGDQNKIDSAIEQLVTDFNGRTELPGELYWLACGYEEDPNKGVFAKEMYERIIKEYPDSVEANKAALDTRRLDIWEVILAGDVNEAQILMDKFIADFKHHPYSGASLSRIAIKYYNAGLESIRQKQSEQGKDYFAKAENVWNRIIIENLPGGNETPYIIYFAASSRQQLNRWDDAIEYYQKVVNDWPDFKYAGGAQCAVGWCYEELRNEGKAPKETVNPLIEEAYKEVINKYPDCYIANYAALRLAELSAEKGDKANAITYYKKFLELTKPGNCQIDTVKAKLAELEGQGK